MERVCVKIESEECEYRGDFRLSNLKLYRRGIGVARGGWWQMGQIRGS